MPPPAPSQPSNIPTAPEVKGKEPVVTKEEIESDLDLLKNPLPTKETNDIFVEEDEDLNQDLKNKFPVADSTENEVEVAEETVDEFLEKKYDLKFNKVLDANERFHFEEIIKTQKVAIKDLRRQIFSLQEAAKKVEE